MLKLRWLAVAVVAFLVCPATPASTQETDRPAEKPQASAPAASSAKAGNILGPEGANILLIAMAPAVQQELKLTEKQKTEIFDLMKETSQRAMDLLRASVVAAQNNPQGVLAAWSKFRQENERAVDKLLEKPQGERLHEIVLRVEGALAVSRPEVSAKLKLTPQQYQQVQSVVDEWRLTQRQLIAVTRQVTMAGGGDPARLAPLRQKATALRDAASSQIGRVLSRKQKDAFNVMLGEPFDLKKIDPSLAESTTAAEPADPSPKKSRGDRSRSTKAATLKSKDGGSSPKSTTPPDGKPS